MGFDFRDLAAPVSVAPMAGGPSTAELAAAGTNAGGLGFVAAGYLSADAFTERLQTAMRLAVGPIGANLFVPGPDTGNAEAIERYAADLAPDADRYGVDVGAPRIDDDAWHAKLDVLLDVRPAVASFTFGLPSVEEVDRLRGAGVTVAGTVTTAAEAREAAARGVDVLVAQGPAAGGHRGTFDSQVRPAEQPLDELLAEIVATLDVPVVAAGGLMTAADIARVRAAGAVAAQLGTAFLLADEAGSSPVHRAALTSPEFTETVVTKAFSGRYARGLRNRFVDDHDAQAPLSYPQVHYLTSPLRAAAVRAGDPHGTNVWAGTGYRLAEPGPVAAIFEKLRAGADERE
ncbi:nitronate monooxygenase [Mycolicibacterium sp. 018/SC-01/001]|uniref:nitronate monooxygenase n=1 Tax=Mycolicibacterium sp. 018/SC-01/001 TaxID=2592069 RepID=UPI00117C3B4A|nr:nitronate monooxygenase [Mycolicibacterium sp. 018/SC-01/001]TRW80898.1 nitronate monooxygenase [Mycolicibacterium sp. 018/SC-01/001]